MDHHEKGLSNKTFNIQTNSVSRHIDQVQVNPLLTRVNIGPQTLMPTELGNTYKNITRCSQNVVITQNDNENVPTETKPTLLPKPDSNLLMRSPKSKPSVMISNIDYMDIKPHETLPLALSKPYIADTDKFPLENIINSVEERPLRKLKNLEGLLLKVFKGSNISIEEFRLNEPELHILVEVLIRKNKNACKNR